MTNKINIGLIGLGRVSHYQLEALQKISSLFHLSAVSDIDLKKKNSFTIPFFQDYKDLLKIPEIEAVLVSTPNHTHFDIAKTALQSHKHVILEKPATVSLKELDELVHLSKEKQRNLMLALHMSYADDVLWFKEQYQLYYQKKFGNITDIYCCFFDPYILKGELVPHALSLGGSWMDSGINALSVVNQFVEGLQIEEAVFTSLPAYPCEDLHSLVTYRFPVHTNDRGGRISIETNWALGIDSKTTRICFEYTRREMVLNHIHHRVTLIHEDGQEELLFESEPQITSHYISILRDFSSHLIKGTSNLHFSYPTHKLLFDSLAFPNKPKY